MVIGSTSVQGSGHPHKAHSLGFPIIPKTIHWQGKAISGISLSPIATNWLILKVH